MLFLIRDVRRRRTLIPMELRIGLDGLARTGGADFCDGLVLRQVGLFDLGLHDGFGTRALLGFELSAVGTGSGDERSGEDRGEIGAVGVRVGPKESTKRGLGCEGFRRDADERSRARGREEVGNLGDVVVRGADARGVSRHWIDPRLGLALTVWAAGAGWSVSLFSFCYYNIKS